MSIRNIQLLPLDAHIPLDASAESSELSAGLFDETSDFFPAFSEDLFLEVLEESSEEFLTELLSGTLLESPDEVSVKLSLLSATVSSEVNSDES